MTRSRTRERQLRRLAERRRQEERSRRRRRALIIGTLAFLVMAGGGAGAFLLVRGGGEEKNVAENGRGSSAESQVACGGQVPDTANTERRTFDAPPEREIDPDREYRAILETSCGRIELELFARDTPVTVNNFAFLARQGFYDGTIFHRVIDGFMNQGGDPEGTGLGGPGYQFEDEFVGRLKFDEPGLLAMANSGPGTNGSQFFITVGTPAYLNGKHTIFGRVLEGMDVVQRINALPTDGSDKPRDTVYIERVRIAER